MLTGRSKSVVDSEIFEKSLIASISKAINATEFAVKEKHARIVIIASHKERSGSNYWHIVRKLPLQDNPLIAWKFCHVTHKLLRDGHPQVIKDSLSSLSFIKDLGKLWGHLKEGYGILIASYTHLLCQKLTFHQKNSQIHGNLVLDDEQLDHLCNNDINNYFELSVDMLDYMDCILQLQKFVFNSMDMSRSNSMTSGGQCRLAPLIPCIQDSCQLYHFLIQILFRLHSSLPADTLSGHRERFYKQFNVLKQFYTTAKNLQYFKNLIKIPDVPNSSPNFLRACELNSHVKPMALVSEPEEYSSETDNDDNIVSDLVDTATSSRDISELQKFQELMCEKASYIVKLENELRSLRKEIDRITKEDRMALESLHNQIQELENESFVQKQIASSTTQENELLKSILKVQNEDKNILTEEKFGIIENLAKTNEDKFQKMKEVYGKLREEHVQLLRSSSESTKRLAVIKKEKETIEDKSKSIMDELENCRLEKCKASEELTKYRCFYEECSSAIILNKSLEDEKEISEVKMKALEEQFTIERKKVEEQQVEINKLYEQLDKSTKEKCALKQNLCDSEQFRINLQIKLNEALEKAEKNSRDHEKYSTEQLELTLSLESYQRKFYDLEAKEMLLTGKYDELTNLYQSLILDKNNLEKKLEEKTNKLQKMTEEKIKLESMSNELLCCHSEIKDLEDKIGILQKEKNCLEDEKNKAEENIKHLNNIVDQQKKQIDVGLQKEIIRDNNIIEKLVVACESMIIHSLSQEGNIHFSALNCTADYLLENIEPTSESLKYLDEILLKMRFKPDSEILLGDLIRFSFLTSETIELTLATAHAASINFGEEMSRLAQKIGGHVKDFLNIIKSDNVDKESYLNHSQILKNLLELLKKMSIDLLPKIEDIQAEKMDDLIEKEMQETSEAIEKAANRIASILASSRSQQSGIQLEVSEKILDSCNSLMMKIRILIEKSKLLQKEIVLQGRGTSTIKDFYKKHHRWTEGLISAAKTVGFGANLLVDAADKVVSGKGKFEELVVCAQEISASTAQLVVSSKVKAEIGSDNLCALSDASKNVSEATAFVVASAKSGAEKIDEIDTFDFSKITLHQAKRKEMDSQVRVLELESLLDKERRRLAKLRKTHYQLADEAEEKH